MKILLAVGLGSFIGGIARYLLSLPLPIKLGTHFPWATFAVNILGCFAIGLVYAIFEKGLISTEWRLFLATGILGGFTTFSAFSYETVFLFRSGLALQAGLYVVGSISLGLLATWLAYRMI